MSIDPEALGKAMESFHPLKGIPVGTPVIVLRDDGTETETRTRTDAWQLGHGAWVVSCEGPHLVAFDLDRVRIDWPKLLNQTATADLPPIDNGRVI